MRFEVPAAKIMTDMFEGLGNENAFMYGELWFCLCTKFVIFYTRLKFIIY